MEQVTRSTEKGPIRWLVFFLESISALTLFTLMMITCVDVVGRYLFNNPLTGSTELTEMALAIVVFSVMPIISWRNDHVVVDLLDRFVPPFLSMVRTYLFNLAIAIALVYLGKRIHILAERSISYEEVTEYLAIPMGWIMYFISYACWITAFMIMTLGIYRAFREYRLTTIANAQLNTES